MARIQLKLLYDLNEKLRDDSKSPLVPKYIAKINIDDLNNLLKFDFLGKKFPIKIHNDSIIQVDNDIQRGVNDDGKLRQEAKKIKEIANILLSDDQNHKAFLGTLVWNVRKTKNNLIEIYERTNSNNHLEYELELNVDNIYLTDSAHRHFGICYAYKQFLQNSEKYSFFHKDLEFCVEIYNLDKNGEKKLFNELNAKQKKITAAKSKQMDTMSPLGNLKESILKYDSENEGLFLNNIEVNSNKNDRHTLMTMAVFTNSIKSMFSSQLINTATEDDDLLSELSEYYCQFFYKLNEIIKIKCKIRGKDKEISPFESLYQKIIKPAENLETDDDEYYENNLLEARNKASELNNTIRAQDKINSNPFIRELCYIGGMIRKMKSWNLVIERVQNFLILSEDGKYFQKNNQEMLNNQKNNHPIATITNDGTFNVQVQTHTLNSIRLFFKDKLNYDRNITAILLHKEEEYKWNNDFDKTFILNANDENYFDLTIKFYLGSNVDVDESIYKLRTEPIGVNWNSAKKIGSNQISSNLVSKNEGYEDPIYPNEIEEWEIKYEINFPKCDIEYTGDFEIQLTPTFQSINGNSINDKFIIKVQKEEI